MKKETKCYLAKCFLVFSLFRNSHKQKKIGSGFSVHFREVFFNKKMRAFLSCVCLKECGCYEPASQFLAGRFIFSVCRMSCSLLSFEIFGDIHMSSSRILFPLSNITVFVVRYPPMIRVFSGFSFSCQGPSILPSFRFKVFGSCFFLVVNVRRVGWIPEFTIQLAQRIFLFSEGKNQQVKFVVRFSLKCEK